MRWEAVLVQEAQRGSPKAGQRLVDALRPRVVRTSGHFARSTGLDAGDLEQEIWVGVHRHLPLANVLYGNPLYYLYQRGRWNMIESIRTAIRIDKYIAKLGALQDSALLSPDDRATSSVFVAEFLSSLNPVQREIVLALLDGESQQDIAEARGCRASNVCYHLRKVREAYRSFGQ